MAKLPSLTARKMVRARRASRRLRQDSALFARVFVIQRYPFTLWFTQPAMTSNTGVGGGVGVQASQGRSWPREVVTRSCAPATCAKTECPPAHDHAYRILRPLHRAQRSRMVHYHHDRERSSVSSGPLRCHHGFPQGARRLEVQPDAVLGVVNVLCDGNSRHERGTARDTIELCRMRRN